MERKYSTLKVGSPLASGDTLLLHGIHYTVEGYGTRFFLSNKDGWDNSEVFRKLSREKDKYAWAAQFGSTCSGDFPEFKDLASLTKFVIAIYEKPEFKAGDYVTINERDGLASDYPASFVDDMAGNFSTATPTGIILKLLPVIGLGILRCSGKLPKKKYLL